MKRSTFLRLALAASASPGLSRSSHAAVDKPRKLVLIAGQPSHPPMMHEFRAGTILLEKRLAEVPGLKVDRHEMGWVADEKTFDDADAVVCFSDGNGRHPLLQGEGRLEKAESLVSGGVGFGCMHFVLRCPKKPPARNSAIGLAAVTKTSGPAIRSGMQHSTNSLNTLSREA